MSRFDRCDVAILSAAVADYTPVVTADEKIKKADTEMRLDLKKTRDILAGMGGQKTNQFLVGFALETNDELANAQGKLRSKNCDLLVLNSLRDSGAGFGHSTNKVTLLDGNKTRTFELKSKDEVAEDIFDAIMTKIL
jgi:phosphopantothenoylcysteine decarboxylase/phosphopantothenate--cysteine ligase